MPGTPSRLRAFLNDALSGQQAGLLGLCVASGLAEATLLGLTNFVARSAQVGRGPSLLGLLVFILCFACAIYTLRLATMRANRAVEAHLTRMRAGLVEQLRSAELLDVERIGSGELYTNLCEKMATTSQACTLLLKSVQDSVQLLYGVLLLAALSSTALLLIILATAGGLFVFFKGNQRVMRLFGRVLDLQSQLVDLVDGVFHGYKSLRLHQAKNDAIFESMCSVSGKIEQDFARVGVIQGQMTNVVSVYLYLTMGTLVFILPPYSPSLKGGIVSLISLFLYLMGPISGMNSAVSQLAQIETNLVALEAIAVALERSQGVSFDAAFAEQKEAFARFECMRYRGVTFAYPGGEDTSAFTVGPWDLDLQRGELIFVVGGNGSGKSTFMRVLCGLYPQAQGTIEVDQVQVASGNRGAWRDQFSAVFADYHLFERLHGWEDVSAEKVTSLLRLMSLDHKVSFADGCFSSVNLSTGQRKRLALVAALAEDKPIYLFDEWTADQDAAFRATFYQEILPGLKAQGKTCVVITHDDRYWGAADRILRFEMGQMLTDDRQVALT